ncbi:hypothetical protein ACSSS7_006258 [Eimeria intestinalis]
MTVGLRATQFCCGRATENAKTAATTVAAPTAAATAAAEASEQTSCYLKSGDILGLYASACRRLLAALPLTPYIPARISAAAAAAGADAVAVAAKPSASAGRAWCLPALRPTC